MKDLTAKLNAPTKEERLDALSQLMKLYNSGELEKPEVTNFVNNHVHTTYSFSPYSPTSAAYHAWLSGLETVGIMDHDSIAGADEFIQAGKIIGIATTCGLECRCSLEGTPFEGKRLNNPDQDSVAYLTIHGVPHQNIDKLQAWITPYRAKREDRNRKMVDNINNILKDTEISLDYDNDVRPISLAKEGGSVTERHLLFALSHKITSTIEKGQPILDFLKDQLSIKVEGNNLAMLQDANNPYYEYYLLGVLKGNMVEQFYIDATDECPTIAQFVEFAREIGGIPSYAYLGDIEDSVTGDKAAQTFEDSFLDQLVEWLSEVGFISLTYMPSRNTMKQLERVGALCDKYDLFQISGEDINTPFQSFICKALEKPEFHHLVDATWALIGHEVKATENLNQGMFSEETIEEIPQLNERIKVFGDFAKKYYNK